tara:strand:+ start:3423 stop:4250 length:828 start_codon:yes stop_codon:yes gene_type:complete
MNKKKFIIIGSPISHSLSPVLHNYWFKKHKINAEYFSEEIKENQIKDIVKKLQDDEIQGLNVTLPYKKKVIPYLSKIINDAKESNSVNTIYKENNVVIGENTDVFGFQAGYLKDVANFGRENLKSLILGAGGVAPSIILALQKSNLKDISLTNRTYEKSLFLQKQFPTLNLIKWEEYERNLEKFDVIINATSLGLKGGEEFKSSFNNIKPSLIYIDTIYNPLQTKVINHLKKKNIKTFNGLDMFIYQGQKAFYLWNKVNPEIDDDLIDLLKSKLR